MLDAPAIQVKKEIADLIIKATDSRKSLGKIIHTAMKGPNNFLYFLAAGAKLVNERIPDTPPRRITLEEALEFREIEQGMKLPEKELANSEIQRRAMEAVKIRKVMDCLIDRVLPRIKKWNEVKAIEILLRSMAFLVFCGSEEKGDLLTKINSKSNLVRLKGKAYSNLLNVYLTFPDGVWGRIKTYPLNENKSRDTIIFKIVADLLGNEFPIIMTDDDREVLFASIEDQKQCFERWEALPVIESVRLHRTKLLRAMEETWEEIKNCKSREISPGGWDKIFVPPNASLGRIGVKYLRFIQEGIAPPSVGLEIELRNGKILVAKINPQGTLLSSWANLFPMATWLINSAALLYLKNLTVGGDSYVRYREERKTKTGEIRETREFLVSQKEKRSGNYRYIPQQYYEPGDGDVLTTIKIARRKTPILHPVRGYKRDMSPGFKPSPEAVAELGKRGIEVLPNRTWVGSHYRGTDTGEETPIKPIKDASTTEELSRLLNI